MRDYGKPKDVDLGEKEVISGKKEVKPLVGVNVFVYVYVLDENKWLK